MDMGHLFSARAVVMKSPPKFLSGASRAAMRIALMEICEDATLGDEVETNHRMEVVVVVAAAHGAVPSAQGWCAPVKDCSIDSLSSSKGVGSNC